MPLKSFRLPFQNNAHGRRFGDLESILDDIRPKLEKELAQLRQDLTRMTDCAAFSFEAMENGDDSEEMSTKLDILTRDLEANRERQLLLERQMSFLAGISAGLPRIPRSHRT
jgi:hypothetical protein